MALTSANLPDSEVVRFVWRVKRVEIGRDKLYRWLRQIESTLSCMCISRLSMDQATLGRIITAAGRKGQ